MTKIEELIKKHKVQKYYVNDEEYPEEQVILIMKEYAEIYARKVLEIAEENCSPDWIHPDDPEAESYIGIEPGSILNIKLPEHV